MGTFRENLREELDFQGMTVKELSVKTGIIKGSLDNYLGVRASIPPADIAVKIATALNVTVEYLVNGKDSVAPNTPINANSKSILRQYQILNDFNKRTVEDLLKSLVARQK